MFYFCIEEICVFCEAPKNCFTAFYTSLCWYSSRASTHAHTKKIWKVKSRFYLIRTWLNHIDMSECGVKRFVLTWLLLWVELLVHDENRKIKSGIILAGKISIICGMRNALLWNSWSLCNLWNFGNFYNLFSGQFFSVSFCIQKFVSFTTTLRTHSLL